MTPSVSATGFDLCWSSVANANGYSVQILDGNETVVWSDSVSITNATVTDLSADTVYSARVKALAPANSTDYTDSGWSTEISVETEPAGGLKKATLFHDTFDNVAGTGWNNSGAIANTDEPDWVFGSNAIRGPKGIRLGTGANPGTATTREIAVSNAIENAEVVISFLAASYVGKTTAGTLTLSNTVTGAKTKLLDMSPPSMSNGTSEPLAGGTNYTIMVAVPARFALRFESLSTASDRRLLLDSIKVTQVYDPNYKVLAVPTGLDTNAVDKTWFSVSWNAVTNATGYEVEVLDESSVPAGTAVISGTNATVSGLSDGATYSVRVRALGDNLHYGDSPLSTAISVTTLADAQKIDFTVTGAPTGDVYAGDTVSFTVTAENESTHEAAEVSFSGIAGATFDSGSGAFSWTTTENDVGSHTVTFTSGAYSTNVTITVVSAFVTTNLFHETFAGCDKKWINTQTAMTGALADEADWTFASHCFSGESGLRIGLKDPANYGSATTRAILPKAAPGTVRLSFRAAGNEAGSTMTVTAAGGASFSQTVTLAAFPTDDAPIPDAAGYVFGPYDIAVSDDFTLAFAPASGDGRMGVDEILVVQTVSARLRELAAPTGLALDGAAGENGFTIGWNTVGNATNYAVRVTDATDAVVFDAPFCAATQATVAGLLDDGAYAVRVRATGDPALFLASPWSDTLAVRTERSLLHPTLSFGGWRNAVGDGGLYAGVTNAAAVSAVRDNGSNAVVALGPVPVSPAPDVGPAFAGGILSWTPADADTNKTFTVSFLLDGAYATNLSFTVLSVPPLQAPDVTIGPVAWNAFGLSWDPQYRAASYGVRAWTDCPNPNATPTRVEEPFVRWPDAKPFGWTFDVAAEAYKNANAPVKFASDGQSMTTYDLGGRITSVSFKAVGYSMAADSVLSVAGIASDGTETPLGSVSGVPNSATGTPATFYVPENKDIRRIVWRYSRTSGGVGVGSVAIEGTGFTTPRWLTGWGPAAKSVGSATSCTVAKARPGKALGPDPANPREDLFETRANYAEVSAFDAAGAFLSTIVRADVPAPPRNVRATMMIVR